MTWQLATVVSGVIAVSYFAIAMLITRGLWKSGQITTNILGVATALIFFSCGGGHFLHAVHFVEDPAIRGLADLHITVWDGLTAMVAVWYLSLRGRYSQLVKGTAMFEDQQRAAAEEQLREQARRDPVTGLLNRAGFDSELERALAAGPCAVLFLDLDGFKGINDRYGHPAGDAVLKEVGARLSRLIRSRDAIARIGGDEFAIVLTEAECADAERIAARVIGELTLPIAVGGEPVSLTASVGVCVSGRGAQAGELLRRADQAMYAAKSTGGADWRRATLGPAPAAL
jgi:diguanylate cyclase (GGDEF)-like protein